MDKQIVGVPFSNSPKLHDKIGNRQTDKKVLSRNALKNADQFFVASGELYKQFQFEFMEVVSVNLAFACELYLKAMLYALDVDFGRTHCLLDLYKLLPEKHQLEIKDSVHYQYERNYDFELVLKEICETFVFLRYAHERKMVAGDWGGLSAIAVAIMKVAKEVVEME